MEKELTPESDEAAVERLLARERERYQAYLDLLGELGEEEPEAWADKEYWIAQEAEAGEDSQRARERLEEFLYYLEKAIVEGELTKTGKP